MPLLKQIAEWVRNHRRSNVNASVEFDGKGITQTLQSASGVDRIFVAWDRVTAAYGYKGDCFSVDQICLLLGDEESKRWMEISEDDSGFETLIEQLPIRIQGFSSADEWWKELALPPFETQWTQLYPRPIEQSHL